MVGRFDIRDNLREDERRRRDEARLGEIEARLEELSRALLEQGSRQTRAEEWHKSLEAAVERLGGRLDAQRAEVAQFNDARQLDVNRLRQATEELGVALEQGVRPIPDLRAQMADTMSQVRAKLQEVAQDRPRFDELQQQLDRLPPRIDRATQIAGGAREDLAGVREELVALRADLQRAADATGLVEQDARRRIGEVREAVDAVHARIDAVRDELPPLDVQIDRVRHELHEFLPRFDELAAADTALHEEVERVGVADFERHSQAIGRIEEVRAAHEAELRTVERLNDTRFTATMARFNDLDEADRHLGHQLALLAVRLDELRAADAALRAEMHQLEELRLRVRLEQAQQETQAVTEHLTALKAGAAGDDDDDDEDGGGE